MTGEALEHVDPGTAFSLVGVLHVLLLLFAGIHVVLNKQNEASAFSWLGIILLAPVLGSILYWLFGINRIRRRAQAEMPDYAIDVSHPSRDCRVEVSAMPALWQSHMRVGLGIHDMRYVSGNRVQALINGDEAYPAMIAAIEGAQHSVYLSSYIFEYDTVGKRFVEALAAAKERGVSVRVMIDGLGVGYGFSLVRADRVLRKRGVRTARFLSTWSSTGTRFINLRNHRKILSVDGQVAFVGGLNIRAGNLVGELNARVQTVSDRLGENDDGEVKHDVADQSSTESTTETETLSRKQAPMSQTVTTLIANPAPRGHRLNALLTSGGRHLTQDVHFRVTGPVIDQINAVFVADWQFASRERLQAPTWAAKKEVGTVRLRALLDGPDDNYQKLRLTLLGAIQLAEHRIQIVSPYFLPDKTVFSALQLAVLRGVRVDICTPARNNLPFVGWAMRANRRRLLRIGVHLHESDPPFDHSKLFIVDDYWSMIGSSNWDSRSLDLNFEINLECYDHGMNAELGAIILHKLSRSAEIRHCDDWHFLKRLRNNFFRLFSPYL